MHASEPVRLPVAGFFASLALAVGCCLTAVGVALAFQGDLRWLAMSVPGAALLALGGWGARRAARQAEQGFMTAIEVSVADAFSSATDPFSAVWVRHTGNLLGAYVAEWPARFTPEAREAAPQLRELLAEIAEDIQERS